MNVNNMINEGAITRRKKLAKQMFKNSFDYIKNDQDALYMVSQIQQRIPNISLDQYKYLPAITRMWIDGQLDDNDNANEINTLLLYGQEKYIGNYFDENANNLSANDFINKLKELEDDYMNNHKNDPNSFNKNSSYKIVKIKNYEEANTFIKYVGWCVVTTQASYRSHTHGGSGVFYFCLKEGFENTQKIREQNCPLDEYGLSMIAVCIQKNGKCTAITTRWNHENNGQDISMSIRDLEMILNVDFRTTFLPLTDEEIRYNLKIEHQKTKSTILNLQNDIDIAFEDGVDLDKLSYKTFPPQQKRRDKIDETFYSFNVFSNNSFVLVDSYGDIVSPLFDEIISRTEDKFLIKKDLKYNFIDSQGNLISPQKWFDAVFHTFKNDNAIVMINRQPYNLDADGNITPSNFYNKNNESHINNNDLTHILTEKIINTIIKTSR